MMQWGFRLCCLLCITAAVPQPGFAASPTTNQTTIQLTVQPARSPNHQDFPAGTLLRELQRQALLISARDELGISTRDMVLRETFAAPGTPNCSTLLCSTQVEKNQSAQLFILRLDAKQPTDPFALADLPVDRGANDTLQTASFPIPKASTIDYLEFITRCEEASRTTYLNALNDEHVLGNFSPLTTQWAANDAPADSNALVQLQHLDVFSQYLAVRHLHAQMRATGASPSRLCALVRAYSNLGQLTRNQWSQANKAFSARALLYAERLVVHEKNSPASLYARAYARAFVGLHAAALQDLTDAQTKPAPAPDWANLIRAWCDYDVITIQSSLPNISWPNTQLATFLFAKVAADGLPTDRQQSIRTQAVTTFPSLFVLDSLDSSETDTPGSAGDQILNQLPTLLIHTLADAQLPPKVQAQVKLVEPGDDTFRQLATLRNELSSSADTNEPSYAVLADLIEQQTFAGIVQRAITAQGSGPKVVQQLATSAQRIIKLHPWKPYVDALQLENDANGSQLDQTLAKVKDHDVGPWIARTMLDRYQTPGSNNRFIKAWLQSAEYSADPLVEDYTPPDPSSKIPERAQEEKLATLRKTSPHSATILLAWMKIHPIPAVIKNEKLFDNTLPCVEAHFTDRPELMALASDWCVARCDYSRSLNLLLKIDALEPTPHTCDQLALIQNRLGIHSKAIENLVRGANLSDDTNEKAALYQRAAHFLIQLHQYDSALSYVQASSEVPTVRVWQLSARCFEHMGRLNEADDALNQLGMLDPNTVAQEYLWARRLNRPNAETIRKQTLAAIAKPGENFYPQFFICLADNQDQQALTLLREHRDQMDDALQFAQLIILGARQHLKQVVTTNTNALHNRGGLHQDFGDAFKSLIQSKNLPEAITTFNAWADRQLDDEDEVDWYSLAGRYLAATSHPTEAKTFLFRAIRTTVRERENYYLAWRELISLGENPTKLLIDPSTQPHL